MYNKTERSKIITDQVEQTTLKALVNRKGPDTIIKHLSKSVKYRSSMIKCVTKEIQQEVSKFSKRSETEFKVNSNDDLMNFKWDEQAKVIKAKVPTLATIISSVIGEKQKTMARLVVAVSVMLYARSQLLNLLQFILGLVLDSCGLNKEVRMHNMIVYALFSACTWSMHLVVVSALFKVTCDNTHRTGTHLVETLSYTLCGVVAGNHVEAKGTSNRRP